MPALRERREDIPLLFRKFAVDFGERYKMPPLRLSEEATELLQSYYWNGNVRQLKNVAEQMSVLESNRDITAATLRNYLPQNEAVQTLTRVENQHAQDNFINERELLYKVLFDMKNDMNQMRKQLNELMTARPAATSSSIHQQGYQVAEEVSPEQPISIAEMEKETIRKALDKNGGNRKAAAEELGLSERTLYRKIKDYGL